MDIQKKLAAFQLKLQNCALSETEREHYVALERSILESEQMPAKELLARAKKIKPLVRLEGGEVTGYHKKNGQFRSSDVLCFCTPVDIRNRSYLYDFTPKKIVTLKGRLFKVPKYQEVGEFTCYHDTGDYYGFLLPSVSEVLQQLPTEYDWHEIDAFELSFPSLDFFDAYDSLLDRHISTVHLYRFDKGLPRKLKEQDILFEGQRYRYNH
ncbi:MAG: hypothetical protein IKN71_08790 [Alphaproteobacteria bacterium]|nr:hypothetical protein [Alphaproteobacteria bacterium]